NNVLEPDLKKLLNIENSIMKTKHVWANVVNTIPIAAAVIDIRKKPFKIIADNLLFREAFFFTDLPEIFSKSYDLFTEKNPFFQPLVHALETNNTERQELILTGDHPHILKAT